MARVFSTGKFDLIRVSQYLMNSLKGGCKGLEYSKNLKKPLRSSTGMMSETLIYHNACSDKFVVLATFLILRCAFATFAEASKITTEVSKIKATKKMVLHMWPFY